MRENILEGENIIFEDRGVFSLLPLKQQNAISVVNLTLQIR